MEILSKHNGITEYQLSAKEWKENLIWLKGAALAETMGPNWKDIYWSPIGRPYVQIDGSKM